MSDAVKLPRPTYRIGSSEALSFRRPPVAGRLRYLAIDPGLDRLSLAWFEPKLGTGQHRYRGEPLVRASAFTHVTYATTTASEPQTTAEKSAGKQAVLVPLYRRLAVIGGALAGELAGMRPALIYIEQPSYVGAYNRNSGAGANEAARGPGASERGRSMMWQALGAILAVAGEYQRRSGADILVVKPSRLGGVKKDDRIDHARRLLRECARPCELPNSDDADAAAVALGQTWPL